jgi:hypothetical protein
MKDMLMHKTITAMIAVAFVAGAANAAPVIYESFSQAAGPLSGSAASTIGLTGNWSDDQTVDLVTPATMVYGDLANAGGQVEMTVGNGTDAWVTTSSALGDAGLLDDGATLWFSVMYSKTSGGGSNEHSGFAFGTESVRAAHTVHA